MVWDGHDIKQGTIVANEDIKVKFSWNANTHTYTATAKGSSTNITITNTVTSSNNYDATGSAAKPLKIGCLDWRPKSHSSYGQFSPIAVKSLKITETQNPGNLRIPTVERLGWTFNGWYTAESEGTQITEGAQVPTEPTTYYAQYADGTKPEIVSVTPSNTLDTTGYVDFTATDSGSGIVGYNITSTDEQPTNWIPVVDAVEEHTETKWQYDAAWARVFHHNNHWGKVYFANEAEAKSVDTVDKYSVLGNLENYRNNDDKFEFLLQYPKISATEYNRWIQNDNPTTLSIADSTAQQVDGFQELQTSWPGGEGSFGGLALSSTRNTLLDGQIGHTNWNYAIGVYSAYEGSMPGPGRIGKGYRTAIVNLWSRIDNKTVTTNNYLTRRIGDISQNGTYYVWVKDEKNNVQSKTVEVNKVDNQNPIAEITSTNDVASSQTATLTMGDNNGVVEYYWGKSNPSNTNVTWLSIESTTNTTLTSTVSNNGTYYLGVKDAAGNVTVVNKAFYKTTLNPGNSTVEPSTIITMAGNSFDIPNPTEVTGYDFNGWFTAETDGTQRTNPYKPTASSTLYAHYSVGTYTVSFDPNGGNVTPSSKQVTYGQAYGELPAPTRDGYEFERWGSENLIDLSDWHARYNGQYINFSDNNKITIFKAEQQSVIINCIRNK